MSQPGLWWVFPAVATIVLMAAAALWLYALSDVFQRPEGEFPVIWPSASQRVVWQFVVVFLSAVGSLMYYVYVMRTHPRRRG